jgi:hypothetical protein
VERKKRKNKSARLDQQDMIEGCEVIEQGKKLPPLSQLEKLHENCSRQQMIEGDGLLSWQKEKLSDSHKKIARVDPETSM